MNEFHMGKKGKKITVATIQAAILVIVIIIVLFSVYASLVPEAQTAGDSMNDSNRCVDVGCFYNTSTPQCTNQTNQTGAGACANTANSIPLASLFGGTGVIFVILMAVLLVIVIAGLLKSTKGGK